MKEKATSLLLALALCLSLLPTAALAEDTQEAEKPVLAEQKSPAEEQELPVPMETDAEEAPEAKTVTESEPDEAVLSVQAQINALPGAGELPDMGADELNAAYMAVQDAYDAYEDLTGEQQAEIAGAECFEALFGWFNEQVAPLVSPIYLDVVNDNGDIITSTTFSRGDTVLAASDTELSKKFYIVQSDVTIAGNLTIDGTDQGGLILCQNATLTVEGALIHKGGTSFFIYGQSDKGKNAGRLIIENSKDDGAAIRSTANNSQLCISSGELELHGGKSGKLVDKVALYSTSVHKGTLTLNGVAESYKEWSNNSSISGGKLVLEYCKHDDADTVWIEDNGTQHHWQCKACGFTSTAKDEHDLYPVEQNTETHTMGCKLCDYKAAPAEHNFVDLDKPEPSSDGTGHTSKMCKDCGYTSGVSEPHKYNESGICTVCQFKPVAKVAKANADYLYADVNDALKEAVTHDDPTVTLETKATDSEDKTVDSRVSFDYAGKNVKLAMNGYALQNSSGNATITVENGTLTVTGDAALVQNGKHELASSAISVTGGELIFNGKLTATGASGKYAVEVTDGALDMQGAVMLTGGLKISASGVLVTKLKKGDVLNGGVSVEGSSTYGTVNALLDENLAFAKKDDSSAIVKGNVTSISEDVTVVEHQHTMSGSECTLCGYTCSHKNADGSSAFADGKCTRCSAVIAAAVGDNVYTSIADAVTAWLANGGTLTLYSHYSNSSRVDFSSASGKALVLDLNGFAFNKDIAMTLGGADLTIMDSREKDTSYGVFGPIEADSGALTLENGGYLQGLTIPEGSTAAVLLRGGKVAGLNCPRPVYTLLPDGYALMNGNITVGPEKTVATGSETYTVKDTAMTLVDAQKEGSAAIGSGTVPFALSLKTDDKEIGRMGFEWYVLKDGRPIMKADGNPQRFAVSKSDVKPGTNGVYTFNAADVEMDSDGWAGLEANKTYDVLCVVNGKTSGSAYRWQTPMRGYKLTVTWASLDSDKTQITVADSSLVYTGSALTPTIKVTYNGVELTRDTDYTVSYENNTNAGTAKATITGMGSYTGTKTADWTIQPHKIGAPVITSEALRDALTKAYDGTTDLPKTFKLSEFKSEAGIGGISTATLTQGEDFTISGRYTYAAATGQSVTVDIALKEGGNYIFTNRFTASLVTPGEIIKATAPDTTEETVLVTNNRAYTYTVDLAALLPKLESPMEYGDVTYALGEVNLQSDYYVIGTAKVEDGKLTLPIKAVPSETEQNIGTVTVKVSSTNIADFDLTINVNAVNKIVPTGAPKLSRDTLAWGETLDVITLSGAMNDGDTEVKGTFAWTKPATTPTNMDGFAAEWTFTPENTDVYAEINDMVTIKVIKATPKGAPGYTKITTGGKTLADAKLTVGTITPEGTIQWVDANDVELNVSTVVTANTAYRWKFTPADKEHYNELTGSITPYSVSSSGSSGGSGSSDRDDSRGVVKVETKTNPDGSTTRTETLSNGTVISTTTYPDGSTTKTTTKKDGSSVTERREANGSTGTVTTDKNSRTEVVIKVSEKAVVDAKKSGEAVKLPVSVKSEKNSNTAPTVRIEMPKNADETKVEIPVENVNSGTVAVLVHEDGTEKILKTGSTTKGGLQFAVTGTVTVKIIDNSKDFSDTRNHWAKDDVRYVTARGLFNGVSDSVFGVDRPMTRGMVDTVLARLAGVDTTPAAGQGAYDIGIAWAKANGVSDGTNPSASVTREQLAAMLYRFSGSPDVNGSLRFSDAGAVSPYAKNALIWATQNGIVNGVSSERIDPAAQAKRAQVAAMMARYLKNLETN